MDAGDIIEVAAEFLSSIGDIFTENPKAALIITLIIIAACFAIYYFCF